MGLKHRDDAMMLGGKGATRRFEGGSNLDWMMSVIVHQGHLFVVGGIEMTGTTGAPTDAVYAAEIGDDGTLGAWEAQAPYPGVGPFPQVERIDDMVYVVGFANDDDTTFVRFAEVVDGAIDGWTTVTHTHPHPHLGSQGTFAAQGRIYTVGGFDNDPSGFAYVTQAFSAPSLGTLGLDPWAAHTSALPWSVTDTTGITFGDVALLLGGVGVASAIHAYTKQKLPTVAILRSLGATARQTFLIYLIQAAAMGFIGSLVGALLGLGVLYSLPSILADVLPLEVIPSLNVFALLEGLGLGLGISLLFAALPLLAIRNTSPLLTLRASFEEAKPADAGPLRWILYLGIALAIVLFAYRLTNRWPLALGFAGGVGIGFALLGLVARSITYGARRFFPSSWSYIWRQGLANLYRPNNQTTMLMLGLGLGTFLLSTLFLAQTNLLAHIKSVGSDEQPNVVLFDIQSDQRQELNAQIEGSGLPLLQQVPIVTMQIHSVKGQAARTIRRDTSQTRSRGNWTLRHEYRSTYRDHLTETETITAGQWRGHSTGDTVFVSLEEGVASSLGVGIGDGLSFDVQGVPIDVVVGSLRAVDWQRVMPNFLVVFPTGVLEPAPQFHVLVTRADSTEQMAALQRDVVRRFPNISVIDLGSILSTVDNILGKVSLVIRFMAFFSVAVGLIVLIGVITGSRYQRIQESVLLKTLGASRHQVVKIMVLEYMFLGSFAAATGLVLSMGGVWGLSNFLFEIDFVPDYLPVALAFVLVSGLTMAVGALSSRGIHSSPPLEVLRSVG